MSEYAGLQQAGEGGSHSRVRSSYSYKADPSVPPFPDDKPIIIFDAQCVLCSGWIKFALWADRKEKYRFLSAQSEIGQALYRHFGLNERDFETNILLENGRACFKSAGSIRMIASLGFPWSVVRLASLLPSPLADRLYELIANNRYRLFGRAETCLYPSPAVRQRFIDHAL